MSISIVLTGDINLRGVSDPAVPFSALLPQFQASDVAFGNLECCLYDAPGGEPRGNPAFFAPSIAGGEALKLSGFHAVGVAKNVKLEAHKLRGRIVNGCKHHGFSALGAAHRREESRKRHNFGYFETLRRARNRAIA